MQYFIIIKEAHRDLAVRLFALAVAESNTQGFEGQIFPYTSPNFS